VVQNPESTGFSRSSGRPFAVAITDDGRELLCVYEFIDEMTIEPIAGYELHWGYPHGQEDRTETESNHSRQFSATLRRWAWKSRLP